MKSSKYKYILFFITVTILATIGLQIFWNIKNFKENRIQLVKEVQTAFDESIEYYYVEDSKNNFLAFVDKNDSVNDNSFLDRIKLDTVFKKHISKSKNVKVPYHIKDTIPKKNDSVKTDYTVSTNFKMEISSTNDEELSKTGIAKQFKDSIKKNVTKELEKKGIKSTVEIHGNSAQISSINIFKGKKATDSISKLKDLANKIIISLVQDSLVFEKLGKTLDKELARKNIDVEYSIQHFKADTIFDEFRKKALHELPLSALSGTTFLPSDQKLQISFSDPTVLILKRSMTEILLSLALSLSIIFCLLYLLKTINKQKKIDEIKNDLISNITHEFKTPITTISSAIEGIRSFNDIDDKEKTERYLNISGQQLKKLEIMVEKLLETASLDTNELALNKESINIVELIKSNIDKHQLVVSEKHIIFNSNLEHLECKVDLFHFENVISNLIDNALKYGGNTVYVGLSKTEKKTTITVEDNGIGIDKAQREKIFDKFYRIPKGNVHDVKGFGIGLFYSKKIIEKHGGTLKILPNTKSTIFKINLPDAE